ncbi:MAG: STAS domain-containing protein [Planctomycetaceae bacterium]|nr:STAS domain-containing protein [Planctomycetaceae bacterium]
MLRITPIPTNNDEPGLRLEGRLIGPWVDELERAVEATTASPATLHLDLSRVQFVDAQGVALLQRLQDHGVILERVTPFVEELLRSRFA